VVEVRGKWTESLVWLRTKRAEAVSFSHTEGAIQEAGRNKQGGTHQANSAAQGQEQSGIQQEETIYALELNVCAVARVVKEKQNKTIGNGVERARPTFL
jgi:hypothetical protein